MSNEAAVPGNLWEQADFLWEESSFKWGWGADPPPGAEPETLLLWQAWKNFLFPLFASKGFIAITLPTDDPDQVSTWINPEIDIPFDRAQKSGDQISVLFQVPPEKQLHVLAVQVIFSEVNGEYPTPDVRVNQPVDLERLRVGDVEHFTFFRVDEENLRGFMILAQLRQNWFAGKWSFTPHEKPPLLKECIACGEPFEDKSRSQTRQYCSDKCKWRLKKRRYVSRLAKKDTLPH